MKDSCGHFLDEKSITFMTRDYILYGIAGSRELERCSVTPISAEVKLLHKWLPPNLGELPVSSVNNHVVRALVNKISDDANDQNLLQRVALLYCVNQPSGPGNPDGGPIGTLVARVPSGEVSSPFSRPSHNRRDHNLLRSGMRLGLPGGHVHLADTESHEKNNDRQPKTGHQGDKN
jgi:hypothetical protein